VTGDPNLAAWTLAVAIFAALVSASAFVVAIFARTDSRRSAAASEVAAEAAEESAAAAREGVEEARRANDRNDRVDQYERNERIRSALAVREQPNPNGSFRFHNDGPDPVFGLSVVEPAECLTGVAQPIDLAPDGGTSDIFTFDPPTREPKHLRVTWIGLDHPAKIKVSWRQRIWVF
jgi:hypothetical protein